MGWGGRRRGTRVSGFIGNPCTSAQLALDARAAGGLDGLREHGGMRRRRRRWWWRWNTRDDGGHLHLYRDGHRNPCSDAGAYSDNHPHGELGSSFTKPGQAGSLLQSHSISRRASELACAHSNTRATRQASRAVVGAGAFPSRASRTPA